MSDTYFVPSQKLMEIRAWIDEKPEMEGLLGKPVQFNIVIDTNVIIRELLWLAGKRKNPDARTSLQETIAAGTAVLSAPLHLGDEVDFHLPKLAEEKNIPFEKLHNEWMNYAQQINWIVVTDKDRYEPSETDDPKDIDFIVAETLTNADAILSEDSDIERMGGNVILMECIITLRDYSRAAAIELNFKMNGYWLAGASVAIIIASIKGIIFSIKSISRVPPVILTTCLFLSVIALIHPTSRKYLFDKWDSITDTTKKGAALLGETIENATQISEEQKQKTDEKFEAIPDKLKGKLYENV